MANTRGGVLLDIEADEQAVVATDDNWSVTIGDAWRRNTRYYRPNRQLPYQEWRAETQVVDEIR